MAKMKFETADLTAANVAKIAEMFPGVVAEGKVNVDLLRSMLGEDVFTDEAYEFTWVGKREAIAEAGRPIRKTLRPCVEESKNWDSTENLYIEGDNLDVLKLLQESYLGKVKMVYIDPPYNTGNDFIYRDNFTQDREEYDEEAGVYDEDGDRMFRNTESNGRFHSDWCSMIYPRLVLARNLLKDDGVIFISIDDNEVAQLRKICDEVFGEANFVAEIVRKRRNSQANLSKNISPIHEYVLIYAKRNGDVLNKIPPKLNTDDYKNPDNDERGPYVTMPCTNKGGSVYSVITPLGNTITDEWRFKKETYDKLISENKIVFPRGGEGKPRYKLFLQEKLSEGVLANTWLDDVASNQEASREIKELFGDLIFDTPKPVGLLKFCMQLATKPDDLILDFFSGSATTAHAVMQLNAEDGGNRRFIMVQLPEVCAEGTEAAKAGYTNICDIGKERIRRAGECLQNERGTERTRVVPRLLDSSESGDCAGVPALSPALCLDTGFRVLKLDGTNMSDVYYAPLDTTQDLVTGNESNIKEDRTDMDLLFGCLLDWGLPLSMPHTVEEWTEEREEGRKGRGAEGKKGECFIPILSSLSPSPPFRIHTYNDGDLIACFDEKISEALVRNIAARKPTRAVFRDTSFTSSHEKINVFDIFRLLAPTTTVRVI